MVYICCRMAYAASRAKSPASSSLLQKARAAAVQACSQAHTHDCTCSKSCGIRRVYRKCSSLTMMLIEQKLAKRFPECRVLCNAKNGNGGQRHCRTHMREGAASGLRLSTPRSLGALSCRALT